jgi:hypothetical protein
MDGGATAMIIASLIIAGTTAYVSYEETQAANERAKQAAINRNKSLADQYASELTGIAVATERETSDLAKKKHIQREAIAAAMSGSGRAVGQGSSLILGRASNESFNLAAGRFGQDATAARDMGYMSMVANQQASWDQYAMSRQNAMLSAISTGGATMASTMAIGTSMKDLKPGWLT